MARQTINIDGIEVLVETELLNSMPPAIRVAASNGTTKFIETFTVGPNDPSSTTSPEEIQGILDNFRQRLAQKVVKHIQLLSMLNQVQ